MSEFDFSLGENYRKYYQRCLSYACSLVSDKAEAELMVSDAFTILWQKYPGISEPLPVLFGIIRNKALNYLRSKSREAAAFGKMDSLSNREIELKISTLELQDPSALYTSEIREIVNDSFEQMGEKTARIFKASRFDGLSNKDVSKLFGIGEKAVEYHLTKALKLLRKKLSDYL